MLDNIVVDCSPLTNTLRIGRLNKAKTALLEWEDREDEIITAVRDFLVEQAKENKTDKWGYEWDRKDGKTVTLMAFVKDKEAK